MVTLIFHAFISPPFEYKKSLNLKSSICNPLKVQAILKKWFLMDSELVKLMGEVRLSLKFVIFL